MSLEAAIAHAIRNDLDIIQVMPQLNALPIDQLQRHIENYILDIQDSLYRVIAQEGETYLHAQDAAGLCATWLEKGMNIPPEILLRKCQTIIQLNILDAQFILDTPEGTTLYYAKIEI